MHATITNSAPPAKDIGVVVFAIVKIENDTLTLAVNDGADTAPATFADASTRYVLRSVDEDLDTPTHP